MTLYQLLDIPETTPTEMVEAAALVTAIGAGPDERRAALAVLSDPEARADYDARAEQGLPLELALAWGVAAFAAGDRPMARYHWERAIRIVPENRAVTSLLSAVADATAEPEVAASEEDRAAAMEQVQRLHHNSAFPHRLIRYAEALARPTGEGEDAGVVIGAARELLQYDIAEAPRAYSMILPVLKEHYPSVYALDVPFFDATLSILADHTPTAEYERKKRAPKKPIGPEATGADYDLADLIGPTGPSGPAGRSRAPSEDLPPREAPRRRMEMPVMPRLPSPGPAWIGALFGALFGLRMGLFGMIRGALLGFLIAYVLLIIVNRQR